MTTSRADIARSLVEAALAVQGAHALTPEQDDDPVIERMLDRAGVRDALREWQGIGDPESLVVLFSIAIARSLLPMWEASFPEREGPRRAILAAERWAAKRDAVAEEESAHAFRAARDDTLAVWNTGIAARWAGRCAAWAANGPRHGWCAVACIVGATKATSVEHVERVIATFLAGRQPS